MIKITNILLELAQSQHYVDRKAERGTIVDIRLPDDAYGEYDKREVKEKLIPALQQELDKRFNMLEGADYTVSMQKNVAVRFFNPIITRDLKEYKPLLITGEGPKDKGRCYLAFVIDNNLATTYPSMADTSQEIKDVVNDHEKRELKNGREAAVFLPNSADVKIDIDELFGKQKQKASKKDIEALQYIPKTDYRVNQPFKHKKYGEGTIINTSAGNRANPDSRGLIDWIEVRYKKPDGTGTMAVRHKDVYSSIYFKEPEMKLENLLYKALEEAKDQVDECGGCERDGVDWTHGQDHEASMADSELKDMISNASKLQNLIQPGDELPGWVSAYISLAADYMHSVVEYMEGKQAEMEMSQEPTPGFAIYEEEE